MICMECQRRMESCICDDADARLTDLLKSPHLDPAWIQGVQAQRLLNKFDIERDKARAKEEAQEDAI